MQVVSDNRVSLCSAGDHYEKGILEQGCFGFELVDFVTDLRTFSERLTYYERRQLQTAKILGENSPQSAKSSPRGTFSISEI